jgi:hypothetical protein
MYFWHADMTFLTLYLPRRRHVCTHSSHALRATEHVAGGSQSFSTINCAASALLRGCEVRAVAC